MYYPDEDLSYRSKYCLFLLNICRYIFGFSFVVWRWLFFTLLSHTSTPVSRFRFIDLDPAAVFVPVAYLLRHIIWVCCMILYVNSDLGFILNLLQLQPTWFAIIQHIWKTLQYVAESDSRVPRRIWSCLDVRSRALQTLWNVFSCLFFPVCVITLWSIQDYMFCRHCLTLDLRNRNKQININ